MIYRKGSHIMTAFGKAENWFVGFVSLWRSQGLGMNSLASAPLLVASNQLYREHLKMYFLHCSCLSLRSSMLQNNNIWGSSEKSVIMCNLLLLCERCSFSLTPPVKFKDPVKWRQALVSFGNFHQTYNAFQDSSLHKHVLKCQQFGVTNARQ